MQMRCRVTMVLPDTASDCLPDTVWMPRSQLRRLRRARTHTWRLIASSQPRLPVHGSCTSCHAFAVLLLPLQQRCFYALGPCTWALMLPSEACDIFQGVGSDQHQEPGTRNQQPVLTKRLFGDRHEAQRKLKTKFGERNTTDANGRSWHLRTIAPTLVVIRPPLLRHCESLLTYRCKHSISS
jgi:hypothetical protein